MRSPARPIRVLGLSIPILLFFVLVGDEAYRAAEASAGQDVPQPSGAQSAAVDFAANVNTLIGGAQPGPLSLTDSEALEAFGAHYLSSSFVFGQNVSLNDPNVTSADVAYWFGNIPSVDGTQMLIMSTGIPGTQAFAEPGTDWVDPSGGGQGSWYDSTGMTVWVDLPPSSKAAFRFKYRLFSAEYPEIYTEPSNNLPDDYAVTVEYTSSFPRASTLRREAARPTPCTSRAGTRCRCSTSSRRTSPVS